MQNYKNRIAESLLKDKLDAMGAVVIEGPKSCGKTTLALQFAKSSLLMSEPQTREQNITLAQTNVKRLLAGETPRLIDEWQLVPQIWDSVRHEIDYRNADGQFLLTGSTVPPDTDVIFHSGTGRFSWLKLRTMSLWESGESSGNVSLCELFDSTDNIDGENLISIDDLAYLICRGGWPNASNKSTKKAALLHAKEYYEAIVRYDMSRVDSIKRYEELVKRIMRSYARNQASQATVSTILQDIKANEDETIGENTVSNYIKALKKLYVIEDSLAWNPNLRSKTAIRSSDTRYFADPSIATAALSLSPEDLLNDMNTFGLLFETMCIRDLRVYTDAIGGQVYHYRDKNQLECDAVIHLDNGKYGLVEVKLGGDKLIEEGVQTLCALASKINTDRMNEPSFLMVLTGVGQYPYRRPKDGVLVVPIGCLKQ